MKRTITITTLALSFVLAFSLVNQSKAQPGVGVNITYQDFYDELSPHGRWIDYPEHGYVWVPRAAAGFRPYGTNGHWVWSDNYEWMWVSDYSWGWAPFHYGRWFHDPLYGWAWVPGYEWSPAWVAWRDGGDYYGWAPLRPGISINISLGGYNPPIDYWCFTPRRYISSRRIYNHYVPSRQNITIINNTTIINNYGRRSNNVFVSGPRRADAERYTGRINPVRFREVNTPGRARVRNNEVSVYRPGIQRDNNRNFAPRSIERYNRDQRDNNSRDNNIVRRNANNLPERRADNPAMDRRNTEVRQPVENRPRDRREGDMNTTPRNFENRGREIERQPADRNQGNSPQRDRNDRQPERRLESPRREVRTEAPQQRREMRPESPQRREMRTEAPQQRREMRPESPQRREMRTETPSRREIRREPQQQQRSAPQVREQRQPRQFESRGNESRSRDGRGQGRRQ